jgi:dTDP-4-dehydrorhamnose 3,5-epimerase
VKVEATDLPGVLRITARVLRDPRGHFLETYHEERYRAAGIGTAFVQDNVSFSRAGVLRGLHFQEPHPQGKLVGVLWGSVFDVAVDMRVGSPTFGRWVGAWLTAEGGEQLYIPPGFAHGFKVGRENSLVAYKCTERFRPEADRTVHWNDPQIGVEWPHDSPLLSEKDAGAPLLAEIPLDQLPVYGEGLGLNSG